MGSGFDGHDRGQTPGVGEGWGGLAGCRPRGCREPDTTERLNSTSKGEDSDPSRASSGALCEGCVSSGLGEDGHTPTPPGQEAMASEENPAPTS